MNNVSSGIISFERYEIIKTYFELNSNYQGEEIDIDLSINVNVKSNDVRNKMIVDIDVALFKDIKEKEHPFELTFTCRGYFSMDDGNDINSYETNAIAILYPYVRTFVSNFTASVNVTPLLLPTININKMVSDAKKNRQ